MNTGSHGVDVIVSFFIFIRIQVLPVNPARPVIAYALTGTRDLLFAVTPGFRQCAAR